MKTLAFSIAFSLFFLPLVSNAQSSGDSTWVKWNFVIGKWAGEFNGQPGVPSTTFSFDKDLDSNILIRRMKIDINLDTGFELPTHHNDLMVVYPGRRGTAAKAIYFNDNGRIVNYVVSFPKKGNRIILTSGTKTDKSRRYRLTYIPINPDMIRVKYESAPPGNPTTFALVNEGNWIRIR